jgi:hypothetical protein
VQSFPWAPEDFNILRWIFPVADSVPTRRE